MARKRTQRRSKQKKKKKIRRITILKDTLQDYQDEIRRRNCEN